MKAHALFILTAALAIGATAQEDAAKKERDKLKGSWTVISAEADGTKTPEDEAKKVKVTFADDKMIVKEGDKTIPATFQLDPGKTPRTIDITASEGAQKGKTMQGIYQVDGDSLKLCLSRPGKDQRPKDFTTKEGSEAMLITLKRDKE